MTSRKGKLDVATNDQEFKSMVARMDERISNISSEIKDIKQDMSQTKRELSGLNCVDEADYLKQFHALDTRLIDCEKQIKSSNSKWEIIWDYSIKLGWILAVAYIFYKLNLEFPGIS